MYTLIVIILASTLQNPKPHHALTATLLYETQFTCDEAADSLNLKFIVDVYKAKHKGASVKRVIAACERNDSNRI